MAIATVSPISITQIIPYSLLEENKKPTFGNRSVEKFLLSRKKHYNKLTLIISPWLLL